MSDELLIYLLINRSLVNWSAKINNDIDLQMNRLSLNKSDMLVYRVAQKQSHCQMTKNRIESY